MCADQKIQFIKLSPWLAAARRRRLKMGKANKQKFPDSLTWQDDDDGSFATMESFRQPASGSTEKSGNRMCRNAGMQDWTREKKIQKGITDGSSFSDDKNCKDYARFRKNLISENEMESRGPELILIK